MSEWTARRFWTAAEVVRLDGHFAVHLDGRPVKTPGKQNLAVPTRTLACAISAEWDAQEDVIDPASMPFTRAANSAIEKVTPQRAEVAEMLAGYGDSDLICYRAPAPDELVARQSAAWDPLLDWAEEAFGARLVPIEGVMYQPQPPRALAALSRQVHALTAFELTGLHDLVVLSGSLVIGLAATQRAFAPDDLWDRSRIDEDWQQEQWGMDVEAAELAASRKRDFMRANHFFSMLADKPAELSGKA